MVSVPTDDRREDGCRNQDASAVAAIAVTGLDIEITDDQVYNKISWRILPLLFAGYVFAYLDRINIGFASLQMKADLGFDDATYGLAAGIFFIGYIICEVPSNLLLQRVGARLTMTRIMVCWGVVSCCMLLVRSAQSFYALRLLLGVFEAGFSPGVLLYLTLWYPQRRIGQMTALFLSGSTVAGLVGAPVSGLVIDHMNDTLSLRSWQWLFLLEGLPSIALGVAAFLLLADTPQSAPWLTSDEKRRLIGALPPRGGVHVREGFREALCDTNVYAFAVAWFGIACGVYAVAFWMPVMLRSAGVVTASHIGFWSTIPYGASAFGMIFLSRHSDRSGERRWHAATCTFAGALALAMIPHVGQSPVLAVAAITVASVALFASIPVLLAMPMTVLSANAAPSGIALINCIGVTGGFLSPYMLGWVKTTSGNLDNGLYGICILLVISTGTILFLVDRPTAQSSNRDPASLPPSRQ